jgi:hypothetical protein
MKHIILLFTIAFFSFNSFSQKNNLVVFSERGERFVLIMNGLRQNADPATNVKVVDLNQPGYSLKVIFEDKSIPDLDKKIPFNSTNMEVVVAISMKKGVRKLTFISEAPITTSTGNVADQQVVNFSPTGVSNETTTTTTTTTTTNPVVNTTTNSTSDVKTNVNTTTNTTANNINAPGVSININDKGLTVTGLNANGTGGNSTVNTTTNTNSSNNTTGTTISSDNSSRYIANGTMCSSSSMTQQQLLKLKYDLDERTVVTKMRAAKEAVQKNCMLSSQVAEIVKMFDYADDQLDIAKFSYQHTYDTKNYDLVVKALQQDYNKPKLIEFIGTNGDVSGSSTNNNTTGTNNSTTTVTVVEQKVVTTTPTTVASTSRCASPMSESEFKSAKQSISSKSFEDTKLTVAKQVMKSKCLNTSQVKEIMGVFSFEESKLDFAKAAYDYVYDKSNYYELSDAFTFETSIEELNKYVESKK